ncbi:hypothetical protein [Candidatus Contubernalis alkaliaceticus]|uniref:hypothetical protein n=1 Tax=Candidatus Contubernalis alkaliaceticus TaxID=338645 RepID=UPI001F4BE5AA|nr:hypothetical protein [Candidatus Contubernalis alkalaceticus]UNC91723.1 hypothetical protein HUE98_06215 [Candidatus Contubernalis alkalaceticus]
MNDQIEVMKQIVELTDTMEEGLEHVKGQLDQRSPEKAIQLLFDTTNAFTHIEKAVQPILSEIPENNIQEKTDKLRSALSAMVGEYEGNSGLKGREILQFILEPAFKNWRFELKEVLMPYTLS